MMVKKALEESSKKRNELEKAETQEEFRRNIIIIGSVLRSLHRKQGTMPYLRKSNRKLFGLPF